MEQIKADNVKAYDWLMKHPVSTWARYSFDEKVKSDHVTNNLSESFNNWVGDLRLLPILSCLDGIRAKLMERIHKRFQQGCGWSGVVTPNIRKKLNKLIEDVRNFGVIVAGRGEFEVSDESCRHIVNLTTKSCDCRGWQLSGIPCKHAAACIAYQRDRIESYCDVCFDIGTYMKIHETIIHPIPDKQMWDEYTGLPLLAPERVRQSGRPRKNRRRDPSEPPRGHNNFKRSHKVTCSICGDTKHNRRGCQKAPTKKQQREMNEASQGVEQASQVGGQTGKRKMASKGVEQTNQGQRKKKSNNVDHEQQGVFETVGGSQRTTQSSSLTQERSTNLGEGRGQPRRPPWGRGSVSYVPVFGNFISSGGGRARQAPINAPKE